MSPRKPAMINTDLLAGATQPKGRARVKPRALSPLLRQCIVEQFLACWSTEDIAESLRLPARTVSDVIDLHILRMLSKPPQSETRALGARRMA